MHCLDHGRHVDSAGSPGPVFCRGPPGRAQPSHHMGPGRSGGDPERSEAPPHPKEKTKQVNTIDRASRRCSCGQMLLCPACAHISSLPQNAGVHFVQRVAWYRSGLLRCNACVCRLLLPWSGRMRDRDLLCRDRPETMRSRAMLLNGSRKLRPGRRHQCRAVCRPRTSVLLAVPSPPRKRRAEDVEKASRALARRVLVDREALIA